MDEDEDKGIRATTRFYDEKHYPRGFGKYGVFTIYEAEALHIYGRAMLDLTTGELPPASKEEHQFIQVALGKAKAKSRLEILWVKYQTHITDKPRFFSMHASATLKADNDPQLDANQSSGDFDSVALA